MPAIDLAAHGAAKRSAVWVVEDSPLQLMLTQRALAESYEARGFPHGDDVLAQLEVAQPDLIILDWNLPGTSGLDVCTFVRSRFDPAALPILILTSDEKTESMVAAMDAGANDFVRKSSVSAELDARVRALLRTKHLHDALTVARREAERANHAKDEFIGLVSHELRGPLHVILGWAQILEASLAGDERNARALATIRSNAELQDRLLGELLESTRIATGTLRVDLARLDLGNLVGSTAESIRLAADKKGVGLALDIREGVFVLADRVRFQQIVVNLVSNAIKFSEPGASITLSLAANEGQAVLGVKDEGVGISTEFLPHVFDRFRQEGSAERRGGLGLGLAIVKSLVELHQGTVHVASPGKGRGSTFQVCLPLARETA